MRTIYPDRGVGGTVRLRPECSIRGKGEARRGEITMSGRSTGTAKPSPFETAGPLRESAPASTRWTALITVALVTVVLLIGVAPASAVSSPGQRYYLSLGDSLAYGFQRAKAVAGLPPAAFDTGYANLLATRIEHGQRPLALVNYGCPGESTVSFTTGPCPWAAAGLALHDPFVGSQQAAALAFLHDHRGRVDLVTLSLWGNDANAFVASCNGNVQCVLDRAPAAIAAIAARLSSLLREIDRAAPDARVVVLGAFDVNIGAFALTHPIIQQLNLTMAVAAAANHARFADPFPVFNPEGDTGATLCTLTLLCSEGDAHPSDAGYRAIADLIETT
jgi:lysophospholipase L1-like esterase